MTIECTPDKLADYVKNELGGKLMRGAHTYGPECCILEARALCMGLPKTDNPVKVGMPDIRDLNDAPWSSPETRAEHMIRLDRAFRWWADDVPRRVRFVKLLAIKTVNVIVAELPGLSDAVRKDCRNASNLKAAQAAAEAAQAAAQASAQAAAWAAARSAWSARSAAAEAADETLIKAVDLWIECAEASGNE